MPSRGRHFNLASAGKARMSLSGSIDIAFFQKKRSITGSVRCIPRISACVGFEIFLVGPAGRYITLQNRMSLASPVGLMHEEGTEYTASRYPLSVRDMRSPRRKGVAGRFFCLSERYPDSAG